MKKIYQVLASTIDAQAACIKSGNQEWQDKHGETIDAIMEGAPSGGGFDSGTNLYQEKSSINKLVFKTAFHHMNEVGYYDGWTEHIITARPHLVFGFTLSVSGRNKNQIKDYILDTFSDWLESEVD